MNQKEKILLVDGHSIVNRAFYGIPPLTNSSGLHTNAIMGFVNIFLNAYREFSPDYVIVAFDVKQKTFRHEIYSAYKGTRKGMPDELHEQVPPLQELLETMGVKVATLPGFEADDVIGTYSKLAADDGLEVVILSGDRDLLQLASDKTLVTIPKTKTGGTEIEKYYAKDVHEKYGVTPKEFIEMKALMGDSSDNIPGIPGIGEKTASAIISKYGSLENAYAHIDEITPAKAQNNLREYIEQGRMSLVLARINRESPVKFDYHEARVESEASMYNEKSYEVLKNLELKKILERFEDAPKTAEEIDFELKDAADFPADVSAGPEAGTQLSFFAQPAKEQPRIGLFVDPEKKVMAIADKDGVKVYKGYSDNLCKLLKSGAQICCFGLKNILHTAEIEKFYSSDIYDIEIMAYLLNPTAPEYTYNGVAQTYLGGRLIPSKDELVGRKKADKNADATNNDNLYKLAAYSAKIAYESYEPLAGLLKEQGMYELFTDIEMPLVYSLYNMEKTGVAVNQQALKDFSAQLLSEAEQLQKEIYEEAGEEFNINSPAQLGIVLFEKLKLPHGKKTKTGYSTSADILEKLAEEFPVVTKILKYRQVVKLRSTYAEGLTAFIGPDGRIHGTFNQTVTATGRISSTEPNLQNIPIRRELGQEIRKAFVPQEGWTFVDADYSQIELRLLAHLSDDKNLIEAYYSDADIHKVTASKVFNTPLDQVTKQQRSNAKAVNFGIVYGISSFGLGQGLSITPKQAGEYIKQYFETYPKVKEYLDNTVSQAKINGFTTTLFGRRRIIPELASSNFMQRSFGERAAMNAPIQGTAADIIKIAMINVDKALEKEGLKAHIVLQIHDELLLEAPADEVEKVKEILNREMRGAVKLSVPLETDVQIGSDWFEAH